MDYERPNNFDPLLAEAQRRELDVMPPAEFWRRVGQRLATDEIAARFVASAVLETLAERIAPGEAEDLISELDPLLHGPVRRGRLSAGPGAQPMPLERFLRRVALREGADVDDAELFDVVFGHVRAVFATLAEAVSTREWFDVIAELPEDYRGVLPALLA